MNGVLTIGEYLRSRIAFEIGNSTLENLCTYRQVIVSEDVNKISIEKQELCYADILSWASTSPSSITGAKDSDAGWKHDEESKTLSITDKKDMRAEALSIYKMYNDSRYKSSNGLTKIFDL
ncbi:MAG: hypothetical protein RR319_01320 [Bacteroides sp.]